MESNLIPEERGNDGPSVDFLKVPSGVVMLVNFVLLFISWCIVAGWKGAVTSADIDALESQVGFYLFCTVTPWLIYIVLFIVLILQFHKRWAFNWPLAFVVHCCFWALFLFIASCVIADRANSNSCGGKCDKLRAAAAFGFITVIGFFVQAFFHYREISRAASNPI